MGSRRLESSQCPCAIYSHFARIRGEVRARTTQVCNEAAAVGVSAIAARGSHIEKVTGIKCTATAKRKDGSGNSLSHLQRENYVPYRLYGTISYLPPGAATLGANISNTLGDRSI
jgi:hypothetical protein